jgi:superfamily II RNA helicase
MLTATAPTTARTASSALSLCFASLTRQPFLLHTARHAVLASSLARKARPALPTVAKFAPTCIQIRRALVTNAGLIDRESVSTVTMSASSAQSLSIDSTSADCNYIREVAGKPAAVDRLRELFERQAAAGQALSPDYQASVTAACFPFPLDVFQMDAMRALASGENVIVGAPTGSGKTAVGEMAILLALARGARVGYLTPLKSLSNQKFYDFRNQFGEDRVGLLTGDVAVNRSADVLVMTQEVYKNMLYSESDGVDGSRITDDFFAVVMDEFHYINDPERGTVWEESVVSSPNHIAIIALSATMANAGEVRDWFVDVQGPTALIESDFRPVPLTFSYCQREGVVPLFADESEKPRRRRRRSDVNGRSNRKRLSGGNVASTERKLHPLLMASLTGNRESEDRGRRRQRRGGSSTDEANSETLMHDRDGRRVKRSGDGRRDRFANVPSFPFVVRALRRRNMLPAIVFIFSRAGCDRAAAAAASERDCLVTLDEENKLRERLVAFTSLHPGLINEDRVELALQGIASHHAGLLPLWKLCVEELFRDGLIKVVFATETLAAGINMPARTTVISAMSKRIGEKGVVSLTTSQVLQMAGRAGRRGMDTHGFSVIMQSAYEGPVEAFKTVTSDVDKLHSHFTPSYGMVLNLLHTRSLDDARLLVERSFGSFLWKRRQVALPSMADEADSSDVSRNGNGGSEKVTSMLDAASAETNEIAAIEWVMEEAAALAASVPESDLLSYIKATERVKAERRGLGYVLRESRQMDAQLIEDTLAFAPPGTRILLQRPNKSGESRGAQRRRKRRELSTAFAAARQGDGGAELRAYYLDDDLDEADELDDDNDVSGGRHGTMEAILLDIGPDLGISVLFSAVTSDGQLCFFTHDHVERLFFELEAINVDEVSPDWQNVTLPERSEWTAIGADQYVAHLSDDLKALAMVAGEWAASRVEVVDDALANSAAAVADTEGQIAKEERDQHPEVYAQRERLEYAKTLVRIHPKHGSKEMKLALQARKARSQLEARLVDRLDQGASSGKSTRSRKRGSARKDGKKRNNKNVAEGQQNPSIVTSQEDVEADAAAAGLFQDFMNIVNVVQHYGFIDDEYSLTAMGGIGAKVRSENELWTSIALMDPSLETASPVHLAAVVGAVLSEGSRNDVYMAYSPSDQVLEIIGNLAPVRARLLAIQEHSGIDFPVGLDVELVGLIEAWAMGDSWVNLLSNTSLQEGDCCRILRRVLDLLRQMPHLPFLSDEVKLNAKRAVTLLDRFPVVDAQTYVVRDSEKMER